MLAGKGHGGRVSARIAALLARAEAAEDLDAAAVTTLLGARGADFAAVCAAADALNRRLPRRARQLRGEPPTSTTPTSATSSASSAPSRRARRTITLRGTPYDLDDAELKRRVAEAWAARCTEVCLQGGIHPAYTGQKYLDVCRLVKEAAPPDAHPRLFAAGSLAGRRRRWVAAR